VEPERLRFDFTHGKPIDQNQIREIEDWINSMALQSVQPIIEVRFYKSGGQLVSETLDAGIRELTNGCLYILSGNRNTPFKRQLTWDQ
jgi:hypothetical protein